MSDNSKNIDLTSELIQLVSFKIGNEEYGVDILKVQEINRILEITQVPNAPEYVDGVVNLRGRIIPVIDLRVRLKMQKKQHDGKTRIIVVNVDDKTVGFLVDEVSEVLRIPKNITEAPPDMVSNLDSDYITAVAKLEGRLLILLDLDRVLSKEEKKELEAV